MRLAGRSTRRDQEVDGPDGAVDGRNYRQAVSVSAALVIAKSNRLPDLHAS